MKFRASSSAVILNPLISAVWWEIFFHVYGGTIRGCLLPWIWKDITGFVSVGTGRQLNGVGVNAFSSRSDIGEVGPTVKKLIFLYNRV